MPVMKGGSRQQGKQETRRRILDAALELFSSEGFEAVTVKRIAERSGLTDGALYYYFQSKQEILTTLMEERWNIPRGLEQVSKIVDEPLSPAILDRVVDNIFDAFSRNQAILRIITRQALAQDPLALKLRKARREAWQAGLLQHFDARFPREDAELFVDVLLSVSFGIFVAGLIEHGREFATLSQREEFREHVHRLIRRAIPVGRCTFPAAAGS